LTRENALILAPVIGLWMLVFFRNMPLKRRFQQMGFFALGMALALMPVGLRNRVVGGEFFLTTSQFGPNFFIGNNEKADGQYIPLLWGRGSALLERKDATELAEKALGKKLTSREVSRYWTNRALDYIRSHPGDWLRLMGKKWLMTWNVKEIPDSEEPVLYYDESSLLAALGPFMHFGTLCPFALLGIYATWKDRRRLALLYIMVLSLAASVALFYVFARYRYPMVPVLVLFAAAGIREVISLLKKRRIKTLLFCGSLLAAAAVIVNWRLTPDENPRAMAHYNMAVGLDKQGETDKAIVHYEKALEYKPDYAQAHINIGILLARKGKLDEAIAHYSKALQIKPHNPVTFNNLANTLVKQGKFVEAIACYLEALKYDPDNPIYHNNLAQALAKGGNLDGAIAHYQQALKLQPSLPEAQNGLAVVLEEKKKRANR
jgi:tetratricopeptide (TPR) repeat protein